MEIGREEEGTEKSIMDLLDVIAVLLVGYQREIRFSFRLIPVLRDRCKIPRNRCLINSHGRDIMYYSCKSSIRCISVGYAIIAEVFGQYIIAL